MTNFVCGADFLCATNVLLRWGWSIAKQRSAAGCEPHRCTFVLV